MRVRVRGPVLWRWAPVTTGYLSSARLLFVLEKILLASLNHFQTGGCIAELRRSLFKRDIQYVTNVLFTKGIIGKITEQEIGLVTPTLDDFEIADKILLNKAARAHYNVRVDKFHDDVIKW